MNLAAKAKQSTDAELLAMLESEPFLARASAMDEIGERLRVKFDEILLQALIEAIREKRNLRKRIRGMITVSHVGMAGLGKVKNSRAKDAFHNLLNLWQVSDRQDLLWFLNTEGVSVDELALA